jgi:tRNA (guanine-N7-)-methyltransferase
MRGISVAFGGQTSPLSDLGNPLPLDELIPGCGDWQVEIGFGKGRYLLRSATENPGQRFLGIEVASQYFRLVRDRATRRKLDNTLLLRGEALYLLSVVLPRGFASAVHVYFPDPWPKARHQNRRLFDPQTVDLVLGLLKREGTLFFASDFVDYAEAVAEILDTHPAVLRREIPGPWDGVPRTNYEAKYIIEGRQIARFEVSCRAESEDDVLHPAAVRTLRAAIEAEPEPEDAELVGEA